MDPITLVNDMPNNYEVPVKIDFVPKLHLDFQPPLKVYTMADLGLGNPGVSPVAVSEPFRLFTTSAVTQMRKEIMSRSVWENCKYSSNLAHLQLRGLAPHYAPFAYDVWRSPEVLSIVSEIAGVDLVPEMDFEIAHINISAQTLEQKDVELSRPGEKTQEFEENAAGCHSDDDKPIVDWHTDSYPFVCVTMLSDCTKMLGGETALRTGTGDIVKVRGPQQGYSVILQGRYIEHQAMNALGTTERITMVTSFRPRSAHVKDDTVLTTVRAISQLPELYNQYTEYRLEILMERVRAHLKEIRERKREANSFNTAASKKFLKEQETFLAVMNREMVDEADVTKGFTADDHLISEDLKAKGRKRDSKLD